MKLRKENKYYSLDKILSKDCDYNLIIGERSNGKTYALLEYSIKQFYTKGEQTAHFRQFSFRYGQVQYRPAIFLLQTH